MTTERTIRWFYWGSGFFCGMCFMATLVLLCGCAPRPEPIQVQRVDDLLFPCDICGKPAKMHETENWYRCDECSRPKPPPIKRRRLEVQIAYQCDRCLSPATEYETCTACNQTWCTDCIWLGKCRTCWDECVGR